MTVNQAVSAAINNIHDRASRINHGEGRVAVKRINVVIRYEDHLRERDNVKFLEKSVSIQAASTVQIQLAHYNTVILPSDE